MGRKKIIEDDKLIDLIQNFYREKCGGNPKNLKLPRIAEYVVAAGYPGYAVESLRRNEKAREYIENLKGLAEDAEFGILAVYKTLDIETLLDTHKTRAALKRVLTELDRYYKTVADAAAELSKKYHGVEQAYKEALDEVKRTRDERDVLRQTLDMLKTEVRALKEEKRALRTIVDEYVYPDIASELLAQAGVFRNEESIIDVEKLEGKIISAGTEIKEQQNTCSGSKVIQGLFRFEEE